MNRSRPLVSTLLLLSAFATPCLADDTSRLAKVLSEAGETADPLAFLRSLRGLGNIDLDRREIANASRKAGVGPGALLDVLRGTQRLRISGRRVEIRRSAPLRLGTASGALGLDEVVRFELSGAGSTTNLEKPRGIKVGKRLDSLYPLMQVVFRNEGGRPVARVKAGLGIFSKTVTVPLGPPPSLGELAASTPPRRGAVGALGALSD